MIATHADSIPRVVPPDLPWGAEPDQRTVWPTPLQQDLLRAALLEDSRALGAWARIRPTLEPATMDHSIQAFLPQLRRNLLRLGVEDPLLELFKGVHRYNWARNQLLMAEVLPVVAALERDGIPTILLKGAALVANERHDAGARQMSDIDVLVPTDSLGAACAVLQDSGMAPVEDIPLWYVTDYAPQFKHSCNFRNRAEGQLDLHWHALKWSCHRDADAEFWAAAQPVRLGEVSSRALCPADELLIVILHGLRWSPTPSYRWILDAALLVRSEPEAIDYDRVLAQARRHRVTHATRSGLLMLRRVAELDVPDEALRALAQAAPLQRLELTAQATQPRWRRRVGRAASLHLQYLRRELAPGLPVSPRDHLRLAAERLGYERPRRVADVRVHGAPGPGRPFAEHGAPLGVGECTPPALPWGTAIDFGDPELVRAHCRYGMWLPADGSSWIAGREAALRIALPEMPSYPLVLELAAGGVSPATHRQRLEVRVGGELVGGVELGPRRPSVEAERFVLPARLVRGRRHLEIELCTADPIVPARLGINDDARPLGVLIRNLTLRQPGLCPLAESIEFGVGGGEQPILAGGWAEQEPGGRWTEGPEARVVLRTTEPASIVEWTAEAVAPLRVEVAANGTRLGTIDYNQPITPARLPLAASARSTDLLLSWRIREPLSPRQLGRSDDDRMLGLFFDSLRLI